MASTERRTRRIDAKLPDTGGGAIVPSGGGSAPAGPGVAVPGAPQGVRIVSTFLLHGQGLGLAGANVAWQAPTGISPDSYLVQWDVASGFTAPTTRSAGRGQTTIALDAMPTGSSIYVRVAAIVAGVQGAWSATASATTPSDTTAPAAPTSLVTSWSGLTGDLTIAWTPPTSQNFKDVRVRIYAFNGGALLRETYTTAPLYVWTKGQQYSDTAGAYDPSVYIVLTARSWGGVFSATDLTGTATLAAPSTPAGLTSTWASDTGTAGAACVITWTSSGAVERYRLSIDGVARDVFGGRFAYEFETNRAEHSGTPDPALSLSLVAVDALGQTSSAATQTATNAAPPATTITVFPAFDRAGLTITASTAQDIKDYRIRVYVATVLVDTFYSVDLKILYQAANGNGSYTFDVTARDLFNQLGSASAQTAAETLEDVASFVASLRSGSIYSDQLSTTPETLFDAYTDDNRSSGGISYASNASWVRWIRFERQDRDRYRTITLSMTPASGTTNWYIRTSEDASTWAYYAGPVTSSRILTAVANAAAAQSAAVSAATLGGSSTSRVDLPAIVSARYVEVWLRNTGASTRVDEFYPRRLIQSDDLEAEAVKAVNIAASAITAGAIAAGAIDGFVITGATIQTAASGERVVLDSTGLKTYNPAGQLVLEATTNTDGALKAYTTAGDNYLGISPSGLQILNEDTGAFAAQRSYQIVNESGQFVGGYGGYVDTSGGALALEATGRKSTGATDGAARITAQAQTSNAAEPVEISLQTVRSATSYGVLISNTGASTDGVSINGHVFANGGVNVGTATGAGTGEVKPSGAFLPTRSSGSALFGLDASSNGSGFTLANLATAKPFGAANNFSGLILIKETAADGGSALFITGGGTMLLVADSIGIYSSAQGTASRVNVYLDASFHVVVENRRGGSRSFSVLAIRTHTGN